MDLVEAAEIQKTCARRQALLACMTRTRKMGDFGAGRRRIWRWTQITVEEGHDIAVEARRRGPAAPCPGPDDPRRSSGGVPTPIICVTSGMTPDNWPLGLLNLAPRCAGLRRLT